MCCLEFATRAAATSGRFGQSILKVVKMFAVGNFDKADEKLIAEAQLHAIAVISKAIAQKAANAAIDIFQKAVMAAVNVVI